MRSKLGLIMPLLISASAAAVTLSAPAAMSAETPISQREDSSEKNICYTISTDYSKCNHASRYCFWDNEDGRCEPLNDTSHCGRMIAQWNCRREPTCFWDTEGNRCETIH